MIEIIALIISVITLIVSIIVLIILCLNYKLNKRQTEILSGQNESRDYPY